MINCNKNQIFDFCLLISSQFAGQLSNEALQSFKWYKPSTLIILFLELDYWNSYIKAHEIMWKLFYRLFVIIIEEMKREYFILLINKVHPMPQKYYCDHHVPGWFPFRSNSHCIGYCSLPLSVVKNNMDLSALYHVVFFFGQTPISYSEMPLGFQSRVG